ncbi:sigma-70 family RNA polymerase sigma factor [Erythrobacter litoralis]|uniref:sigma-70 family RNA polymerase sigma factor n=1 Tax=Erythrobacter litoralis TaxID=39960 RepID=UPI0024354B77|nr:sigma-70 family RNA polymerase sigma factor [Erythrobacter litoralis]MDG6078053.1 sigma-70 family RNA polymerase sigma factor [Erythrobacter litoralis]
MNANSEADRRERLTAAMRRTAEGDRDALHTVYSLTSAKLFAVIVRIVDDREQAEDVLQEVFVKVWHRAGRFDPAKGSPITWLCTVARNTALNDIRGRGIERTTDAASMPDIADERCIAADDWLCSQEDNAALNRCIEDLQPDHKRSIKAAFFGGYSYSELAHHHDVPLGTMKSWIRRGLAKLRGCLDG